MLPQLQQQSAAALAACRCEDWLGGGHVGCVCVSGWSAVAGWGAPLVTRGCPVAGTIGSAVFESYFDWPLVTTVRTLQLLLHTCVQQIATFAACWSCEESHTICM
jgi:hypothetical protein